MHLILHFVSRLAEGSVGEFGERCATGGFLKNRGRVVENRKTMNVIRNLRCWLKASSNHYRMADQNKDETNKDKEFNGRCPHSHTSDHSWFS